MTSSVSSWQALVAKLVFPMTGLFPPKFELLSNIKWILHVYCNVLSKLVVLLSLEWYLPTKLCCYEIEWVNINDNFKYRKQMHSNMQRTDILWITNMLSPYRSWHREKNVTVAWFPQICSINEGHGQYPLILEKTMSFLFISLCDISIFAIFLNLSTNEDNLNRI